ncbi:UNVERIFIED_CONTAM: hypothetical protein FKN15_014322 [Acipenser sinensis]
MANRVLYSLGSGLNQARTRVRTQGLVVFSSSEDVLPSIHADKHYPCELVGTWNTWYGEQDQAVHLWRYDGGYPALTEVMSKLRQNKYFIVLFCGFLVEAYKDLQSREDTRNAAWQQEGWDECVYYTVPLIQHMESRIMIPMKSSPLQ